MTDCIIWKILLKSQVFLDMHYSSLGYLPMVSLAFKIVLIRCDKEKEQMYMCPIALLSNSSFGILMGVMQFKHHYSHTIRLLKHTVVSLSSFCDWSGFGSCCLGRCHLGLDNFSCSHLVVVALVDKSQCQLCPPSPATQQASRAHGKRDLYNTCTVSQLSQNKYRLNQLCCRTDLTTRGG